MMNIKKLLRIDLAHPRRSWRALKEAGDEDVPLFNVKGWRFRFYQRKSKTPTPTWHTRALGARWRGPRYFRAKVWREDLIAVTEQISAIVRANAPLARGLEAAGHEAIRIRSQLNFRQIFGVFMGMGYGVSAASVAILFSMSLIQGGGILSVITLIADGTIGVYVAAHYYRAQYRRESVLLVLSKRIGQGRTLSEVMHSLPRFFPRFYADLVETGEATAQVASCFDELNDETLQTLQTQDTVRNNLYYIAFVLLVQGAILSFMVMKVVPVFEEVYGEFGGDIPGVTRALIDVTDWLVYNWPTLMLSIALIGIPLILLFKGVSLRKRSRCGFLARPLGSLLFVFPWFRGLIIKQNLAMAALILEKLLHGGATLDAALESVSNAGIHPLYTRKFSRIRDRVLQGETLSEACDANASAPPLPRAFRGFIALGENAGMLPAAIARIGRIYQRDVEMRIRILSDAFLPFAVVALGYFTLLVLLSLYLPIFSLTDQLISQM